MSVKIGAVELSEDEVKNFREVFDLVDKDHSGNIDAEEVKELMGLLGMFPSKDEVEKMISEIDKDGNGEVDFEEFLVVMAGNQELAYSKRDLLRSFRIFADKELPPGYISPECLEKALTDHLPDKVTMEEAMRLVQHLEVNPEGLINYVDKVNLFMTK
mmetsp:Transcript_45833/g.146192  ORF Transcript_45833/g.146192 Transcript_45833/m.146192 type:complete len:158 (-) Transcript_45833:755-1228(-)